MRVSLLTALALLLAYAVFVHYVPRHGPIKTQSQWQTNRVKLEKYVLGSVRPTAVIVGSSLAARLDFPHQQGCIYNMALAGESALTGLSAVVMSDHTPRYVLVEVNVPQRGVNREMIGMVSSPLRHLSSVFHTENIPANVLWSELSRLKKSGIDGAQVNDAAFQKLLQLHADENTALIDAQVLAERVEQFKELVQTLKTRGSTVILFEMPVHPSLESSNQVMQVRTAFEREFSNGFLAFGNLAKDLKIRTSDGLHLVPEEARLVSSELTKGLSLPCPEQRENPSAR